MAAGCTTTPDVTVLVAASAGGAMEEAAFAWGEQTQRTVRVSAASSSMVVTQLESGVRADLVLLANASWAEHLLHDAPVSIAEHTPLLTNRLVVISAPGTVAPALDADFPTHFEGCLALGDPAYVPGGMYAQQSLISLDLWDALRDRVAPTLDAPSAVAVVSSGTCPVGIVYRTDAERAEVVMGPEVPASSHAPIRYPLLRVVHPGTPEEPGRQLYTWLQDPEARAVFARHGFGAP